MTQEDKDLLLRDLCCRLPYKVYVNYDCGKDKQYEGILDDILPSRGEAYVEYCLCDIDDIRPYLRPMSSMTDEEWADCVQFQSSNVSYDGKEQHIIVTALMADVCARWNDKHMFDHRGLLLKGLALVAPTDMYVKNK